MTNELEVNPAQQPEKVEVSPAAAPVMIACKKCGNLTPRTGRNSKYCSACRPDKKTANRASQQKVRDKRKATSFVFDSSTEPTKSEAKELLAARGLSNQHIIDLVYDLALIAAEQNHVPANRFMFQNGIRKLLESYQSKSPQPLEEIPADEVAGELLNRAELYCLYDFGFWRQPDAFEQWLADRLKLKSSTFEMSKILGKEDFGKIHEEWVSFAPRWNPIGLKPNYTQREALTWLDAQNEKKKFLLVSSRNSFKSTWIRINALCLTVSCPDAPILIISERTNYPKRLCANSAVT